MGHSCADHRVSIRRTGCAMIGRGYISYLVVIALFGGVIFIASASHCGQGFASEDLAGTCRASPPSMGALEVVTAQLPRPDPPNITVDPGNP